MNKNIIAYFLPLIPIFLGFMLIFILQPFLKHLSSESVKEKPCSEYGSRRLDQLPARCIKYFEE